MSHYSDRQIGGYRRRPNRVVSAVFTGGLAYILAPAAIFFMLMILAFVMGKINSLFFGAGL